MDISIVPYFAYLSWSLSFLLPFVDAKKSANQRRNFIDFLGMSIYN